MATASCCVLSEGVLLIVIVAVQSYLVAGGSRLLIALLVAMRVLRVLVVVFHVLVQLFL